MAAGKLLIIGGTGFVGKAIIRHLKAAEKNRKNFSEVCILSRNPGKFLKEHGELKSVRWLNFISGDVLRYETLKNINPKYIIHAAADSASNGSVSSIDIFEKIINGTRNVLRVALEDNVSRVLYLSSGAVYGAGQSSSEGFRESDACSLIPYQTNAVYGISKLASEHLHTVVASENKLEFIIARCFSFIGPDLPINTHFAVGNFIRDALWSDEIIVSGDGTPLRSFLDQTDLAIWLLSLLHKGRPGETYNVGSDRSINIADLAYLVRDIVSPNKRVRILNNSNSLTYRCAYIPNIKKIQNDLKLRINVSLEDSIKKMADELKERSMNGNLL